MLTNNNNILITSQPVHDFLISEANHRSFDKVLLVSLSFLSSLLIGSFSVLDDDALIVWCYLTAIEVVGWGIGSRFCAYTRYTGSFLGDGGIEGRNEFAA